MNQDRRPARTFMMSLFDAQSRARPAARLAAWARQRKKRVAGPMRIVDECLVKRR